MSNSNKIHREAWANQDVAREQLDRNIGELNGEPPVHWGHFYQAMDTIVDPTLAYNFLDVGCASGAYLNLCKKYNNLKYEGIDFSPSSIALAQKQWGTPSAFKIMDYKELTPSYASNFNILHLGALLDVLPNGDEALNFILDLQPQHLILGRVNLVEGPSTSYKIKAYAGKTFIRFNHNRINFFRQLQKRNLDFMQFGTTFHIKTNNE